MNEFFKKFLKKYIGDSSYKKNVLAMVVGRIISQSLPILLTPILARMYAPSDFGVFGVYSTIVSIIAMVSTGRYCLAIILPKKDSKVEGLFLLSSLLTVLISFTFFIILIFFKEEIFTLLNVKFLSSHIFLLSLNVLFLGLFEAAFYYGLRKKQYKILSTNIIIQSLVNISARLLFGYFGNTQTGLLVAYLMGYSVSYILLFIRLKIFEFDFQKAFKILKALAKEYIQFPKFSLFADLLSMGANLSPNLFVNKIFGTVSAGYYSMSDRVLGSPIWFVMSSVGDVFKQEASEQFREKGNCYSIFNKTIKSLFFVGIIPFLLLFIFAPMIVPIVFGPGWEPVTEFIRIFTVMYFAKFVIGPVSYIVYIVNKQRLNIFFQLMRFIAIVIAFVYGAMTKDLSKSLIIWSVLTTLSYIIILIISFNIAKNSKYPEEEYLTK